MIDIIMWKDILDFEDRYQVSELGEIRNKNTLRILTLSIDKDGYQQIGIRKNGNRTKYWFRVHRLVALAFIEVPENWKDLDIDHIDRNTLNNKYGNLRWCTKQENCNNRKNTCWETNKTTGELYITKYPNGYMLRINNNKIKHKSWHKELNDAILTRNKFTG